jgi:hypothetical protein
MDAKNIEIVVNKLTGLGIKPGKDVADALRTAKLPINLPTAVAALDVVERADTQEALDQAVNAYAFAKAVEMVGKDPGFVATVNERRSRVAQGAVSIYMAESIGQLCDRFNEAAPAFAEALNEVPAGAVSGSVLDLDPGTVAAIQRAKETAAPLLSALDAYDSVLRFLGIEPPRTKTGPGASALIARISTDYPTEDEHLWSAVNDVVVWSQGGKPELEQLYPLVPVVRNGGRLNLVDPAEADSRMVEFPDARRARFA